MSAMLPLVLALSLPSALMLVVALLLVPAAVMLWLGVVGRQMFTEPRCVRCGYDLRKMNVGDDDVRPCPECGADLSQLRAVRFGKRVRRPWFAVAGVAWLLAGAAVFMFVVRYQTSGPAKVRGRSNAALISGLMAGHTPGEQIWYWQELERRLEAGTLSQAQVDDAVTQLATHLDQLNLDAKRMRLLHWQGGFIERAMSRDMVSPEPLQRFCEAYYNLELRQLRAAVRSGHLVELRVGLSPGHEIAGTRVVYALRAIVIDGRDAMVAARHDITSPLHADARSGRMDDDLDDVGFVADAPPGDYDVTYVVDVGILPQDAPLVGLDGKPGQLERWQTPLFTWTKRINASLHVTPADQSPVELITDSLLDVAGRMAIERLYTVPLHDGVRIVAIVRDDVTTQGGSYCFRVRVCIGDDQYTSATAFGRHADWQLECVEHPFDLNQPLPADVTRATVILEPAIDIAEGYPAVDAIWGEPIVFENVPLERHDLDAAP